MIILGLSFDYHDSAAALLVDGEIVAAAQEERFTRRKHDERLPVKSIEFCLKFSGIRPDDVERVVFYEKPLKKLDRILHQTISDGVVNAAYLNKAMQSWIQSDRISFAQRIHEQTGIEKSKVRLITHHQSHASSAFFCSPFAEATVITLDGVGEWETMTVSVGRGNDLQKLYSISFPDSIGLFYSAFTAFLGFEVNEGEYKVMGMAAFGKPLHADKIRSMIKMTDEGGFSLDHTYFNFRQPTQVPYTARLIELMGPPRQPESDFEVEENDGQKAENIVRISRHYANIAASVQVVAEELILHIAETATRRTGISAIALAGGVALNSLANSRLLKLTGDKLFVQPAAGDSGAALGAALWQSVAVEGASRPAAFVNPYLGETWAGRVENELREIGVRNYRTYDDFDELTIEVAGLLAKNMVIGWMQGRFEWGPRSLGARSILASPCSQHMKRIVNEKIKFREPFRPFAPAVLEAYASAYFDIDSNVDRSAPVNFMLSVSNVNQLKRHEIPAVTHADGTARVQIVRPEVNQRFHALISAFHKITGTPVLLNTSFNLRGEPIVNSPRDALNTFSLSGMDYLVIENCIIDKKGLLWS
jgi:carbamoyltransferase